MNGLADLGWALLSLGLAASALIVLIAEHAEIGRRLRQGGRLLAEAGPWLVAAALHPWALRGRRMPPAQKAAATPSHPSVRPPGLPSDGRPLDDYEQRSLDSLELRARVPQQGVDRSADYCRLARWRTADPAERARALGVPKPPPVITGQLDLLTGEAS